MQYSVRYNSQNKDEAEEIKINYIELKHNFKFIMKHSEKRINVFFNKKQIPDDFEEQIVFIKDTTNKYTV